MKTKRTFVMGLLALCVSFFSSCTAENDHETEALYDNIEAIDKEDVEDPGTRGEG